MNIQGRGHEGGIRPGDALGPSVRASSSRGTAASAAFNNGGTQVATTIPRFVISSANFVRQLNELISIVERGQQVVEEVSVLLDTFPSDVPGGDAAPRHFRRFIDLLDRDDFVVERIGILVVDCWHALSNEQDMERLFGQVLPSHPTLREIEIMWAVPSEFLRRFTESVFAPEEEEEGAHHRPSPLRRLLLRVDEIGNDLQAIAAMVNRHVPLESLTVNCPRRGARHGGVLCQAVARNTNIQEFRFDVDRMSAETLGIVASSPSLRDLSVRVRENFALKDAFNILSTTLRTNTTLTRLDLELPLGEYTPMTGNSRVEQLLRPLWEDLETYNFTLQQFLLRGISMFAPWDALPHFRATKLLRRNERLQRALVQMEPRTYRVKPDPLVPSVLGMVSALPTLLYRFLRKGNAKDLFMRYTSNTETEGKAEASAGGGRRKRGRPNDDDGQRSG